MPIILWNSFLRWLGPHNYNYPMIFITVVALNSAQGRIFAISSPSGLPRAEFFLKILALNLVLGLIVTSACYISFLLRRGKLISLTWYLCEVLFIVSVLSLSIFFFNTLIRQRIHFASIWGPNDTIPLFLSRFVLAILFLAFSHNGLSTLQKLLKSAIESNEVLDEKYRLLIESDEEIRGQVARYLHDRVQAEITLVSAKLFEVAQVGSEAFKASLTPVIIRLEKIRSVDLQLVAQILTPNFASEGFSGSIETLCEQYQSGIKYQVVVNSMFEESNEELLLGVYRIVEQAVINAITHGPASKVLIKVERTLFDTYLVEISDNGPGSLNAKPGKGSVIIDAWCSMLGGMKSIETSLNNGYKLRVTIPIR